MSNQVFINFAVNQLQKSMDFYAAMGFTNNPQFSDDTAKCMMWSDSIYVMIMSHEKFSGFITKPLADNRTHISALYSLSVESEAHMHQIVEQALAAGGKEPKPLTDYGFMLQRTVEDPDGHTWEIFYMDMSKFPSE